MNLFNLFNLFKSLNMTTFLKVVTPSSDPTAPPIEDFSKKYFAGRCRNSGNIIILDIGDNQKVPVVRDLTSSHVKLITSKCPISGLDSNNDFFTGIPGYTIFSPHISLSFLGFYLQGSFGDSIDHAIEKLAEQLTQLGEFKSNLVIGTAYTIHIINNQNPVVLVKQSEETKIATFASGNQTWNYNIDSTIKPYKSPVIGDRVRVYGLEYCEYNQLIGMVIKNVNLKARVGVQFDDGKQFRIKLENLCVGIKEDVSDPLVQASIANDMESLQRLMTGNNVTTSKRPDGSIDITFK